MATVTLKNVSMIEAFRAHLHATDMVPGNGWWSTPGVLAEEWDHWINNPTTPEGCQIFGWFGPTGNAEYDWTRALRVEALLQRDAA